MSELRLVPYQDTWPSQFLQVAGQLRSIVPAAGVVAEHIGSTAVPGLCSKPVLDILLGVSALSEAEAAIPTLVEAGYVYRPEYQSQVHDRRYFVKPAGALPRVHLHAVTLGGRLWHQHLHFRDQLRQNGELRRTYAALKKRLAVIYAADKVAYTEGKAPFIRQVLASCPSIATATFHGSAEPQRSNGPTTACAVSPGSSP